MRFRTYGLLPLLCLLVLIGPNSAKGQNGMDSDTTGVLTLSALIKDIRASHPALQAAALHTSALEQTPAQASAWPDPIARVTYQPAALLTARGAQRSAWSIEQTIPYPGKQQLKGTIAQLNADMAGSDQVDLDRHLILEAKQAYYTLYRLQQEAEIVEAYHNRLLDFETSATSRYEVGLGPQQAILRAQLELHAQAILRLRNKLSQ